MLSLSVPTLPSFPRSKSMEYPTTSSAPVSKLHHSLSPNRQGATPRATGPKHSPKRKSTGTSLPPHLHSPSKRRASASAPPSISTDKEPINTSHFPTTDRLGTLVNDLSEAYLLSPTWSEFVKNDSWPFPSQEKPPRHPTSCRRLPSPPTRTRSPCGHVHRALDPRTTT